MERGIYGAKISKMIDSRGQRRNIIKVLSYTDKKEVWTVATKNGQPIIVNSLSDAFGILSDMFKAKVDVQRQRPLRPKLRTTRL